MGYHKTEIPRGEFGEFSKIKEEFLEAQDALEQNNHVMLLVELSDLLGAIEAYVGKFKLTLDDLIVMKNATKQAFNDGTRTSRTILPPLPPLPPLDRIIKEGVNPEKYTKYESSNDEIKTYTIDDIEKLEKIIKKDKNKRSTSESAFLSKARQDGENTIYAKILTQLGFIYKFECKNSGKPIWKYRTSSEYICFDNKSILEFDPLRNILKYISADGKLGHFNTQIKSEQELLLLVIDRKNNDIAL